MSRPSNRTNLHVYPSTFRFESRILKETHSIVKSGIAEKILIVAMWEPGLSLEENIDEHRTVRRLATVSLPQLLPKLLRKLVQLAFWHWSLLRLVAPLNVSMVNAHSLTVLPASLLLKWFKGARLIYDTHELETETAGARGVRRFLSKLVERVAVRWVDLAVVVNSSIGKWYAEQYPRLPIIVVRNVPESRPLQSGGNQVLRERFSIPNEAPVFLYQGVFGRGRGIEILLDAFAEAPDKHLVFLGYGDGERDWESLIDENASRFGNIHRHPAVPSNRLLDFTLGADIGLSFIENISLSYYLSLPNKLFEYLVCGVPVIASNFPEMRKVIEESGGGWLSDVDSASLKHLLSNMTAESILEKRNSARLFAAQIGWSHEERVLVEGYEKLGVERRGPT